MEAAIKRMLNSVYSKGWAANYRPCGLDSFDCKLLKSSEPDQYPGAFESQVNVLNLYFTIRVSDLEKPTEEDIFVVDGIEYLVTQFTPKNEHEWLLTARKIDG